MLARRIPADVALVDVYRNLRTGTWSAKAASGRSRGLVVSHPLRVVLTDAMFRVNARGRDKVRATCSKNVHSVVRGVPAGRRPAWPARLTAEVGYNPYLFDSFVILANGQPILRAAWVEFPDMRARSPLTLRVGLHADDAALLDAPRLTVDPRRVARMNECRDRRRAR